MTSNSNQSLYAVWGTSASSVWAVGGGGTALYYDGIKWQARPTPQEVQGDRLVSVSGTADNNVFAAGVLEQHASGTSVIRFDGTSWSYLGRIPVAQTYPVGCVGAYATNDAFVWGRTAAPGGAAKDDTGTLYRVTNGVATLVMATSVPVLPEPGRLLDPCILADRHRGHWVGPRVIASTASPKRRLPSAAR